MRFVNMKKKSPSLLARIGQTVADLNPAADASPRFPTLRDLFVHQLQDLFSADWPANQVEHDLECIACGRTFQLFADTYLGHAGWGVTGPQTKDPTLTPIATV